jgi:hypothetical protein
LRYRYRVDGLAYHSDTVVFGALPGFGWSTNWYLDRYPVGARIEVHYDPGQPEISVLDTSGAGARRQFTAALLLLVAVFCVGWVGANGDRIAGLFSG